MPDTPKRRWFQFKLRTLLLAVVLIGSAFGWLGWQFKIVNERRYLISHAGSTHLSDGRFYVRCYATDDRKAIPFYRRWMGDRYYTNIGVDDSSPDDVLELYRSRFPEAYLARVMDHAEFRRRYGQRPYELRELPER